MVGRNIQGVIKKSGISHFLNLRVIALVILSSYGNHFCFPRTDFLVAILSIIDLMRFKGILRYKYDFSHKYSRYD